MNMMDAKVRAGGLMHLSDLHFGQEDPVALEALRVLVDELQPELIVVTGDLTQRATRAQFAAAHLFLEGLPVPHLAVQPGNHDVPLWAVWERCFTPFRRYTRTFGHDRTPLVDLPWLRLVMAESVTPWRQAEGALPDREIERVRRLVAAARPGQLRVVTLHHPPVGGDAELTGGAQAVRRWLGAGLDLLLSGHSHTPAVQALGNDRPGADHQAWSLMGGTAVSRRLRRGMSASVSTLMPAGGSRSVWVQRWDLSADVRRFLPRLPLLLPLRDAASERLHAVG